MLFTGETITVKTEVGNGTSSTVVPTAELEKKLTYYDDGRITSKRKSHQLRYEVGEHVKPNTSEFKGEIKLHIPKDACVTLKDCEVLDVEYVVTVSLRQACYKPLFTHTVTISQVKCASLGSATALKLYTRNTKRQSSIVIQKLETQTTF